MTKIAPVLDLGHISNITPMLEKEKKPDTAQHVVDSPYEEGVFGDGEDGRPLLKFAITNWLPNDVHTKWLGKDTVLKAGDMRECGHAEAYHFMKIIVDKHIFDEAAGIKDPKEREKMEMNVLSPGYRKPLEAKTIQRINDGEESPVMRKMRAEIEKQVRSELAPDASAGVTSQKARAEFEE